MIRGKPLNILLPPTTIAALRAAGRAPALPFSVVLADGRVLTMTRLLRVLPARRLVGEALLDGCRVFAKLFIGRNSAGRWRQEQQGLRALADRGLRTPRLLAAMTLADAGHALLTEFLDPAETLAQMWARLPRRSPETPEALALLTPALALLGRLHSAGLIQRDLHLGNFLYHGNQFFLVDGDSVRDLGSGVPLGPATAGANLAVFLAQLPAVWDSCAADLLALYGDSFTGLAPALPVLQQEIARVRSWRLRDFLAKSVRDCSLFSVTQTTTRFSAVLRVAAKPLATVMASPDDAIKDGLIFKDGGTTTCARLRLPDYDLLIKRYNLKSVRHALGRVWRPSRAWHSWRAAHLLRFLDIPTPAPLALIEERFGPLRRRAWLVTEYSTGPNLLHHLSPDREPPPAEAEALLTLFQTLHRRRISHGDLKATNLLWDAGQVLLIDLDTVVQHRSDLSFARAWRRDRLRLLRNWPSESRLCRWFDRILPGAHDTSPP